MDCWSVDVELGLEVCGVQDSGCCQWWRLMVKERVLGWLCRWMALIYTLGTCSELHAPFASSHMLALMAARHVT